jgi:ribosomal protein S18 acetylase RimI-like enzyme
VTEIVRGGPEVIDELQPLWLAMVHHHAEVAPDLGAVFDDDEAWRIRHKDYSEWLLEDDAFVLVARDDDGRAVGYALVTVNPASATWREPARVGLIESLSILPEARGAGIGRALVEGVASELARIGVHDIQLSVISANATAQKFYESLGFAPMSLTLRRRHSAAESA